MGKSLKSKAERTRGEYAYEPRDIEIRSKASRTYRDLLSEHRIQMLDEARMLGLASATTFEIAQHFDVDPVTIRMWRAKDAEFDTALKRGQLIGDGRVEASLFDRAVGYSFVSEEIKVIKDKIVRVPVVKHVEPNVTAQIFWLKNRQRDRWRDNVDHTVDARVEVNDKSEDPRMVAMAIIAALRDATGQAKPAMIDADAEDATEVMP